MENQRRPLGVPTSEVSARRTQGWYLGRIYEIHRYEDESVSTMFADPGVEQQYRNYINSNCRRNDLLSLCISTAVVIFYAMKGDFSTRPASILLILVAVSLACNLAWILGMLFSPAFALANRRPVIFVVSWYVHMVIACMPPLSCSKLKAPSSARGAYMVRVLDRGG